MDFLIETNEEKKERSPVAFALACITGGAAVAIVAISAPFIIPALRKVCLPYVPATSAQVKNVMTALDGRKGRLVDLGSGDGRIVIAAAKAGYSADGVELNPWLVLYSRFDAFKNGVSKLTSFYRKDLWKFPLTPYENIVIFGVKEMMVDLESKMETELTKGTQVIACRFPLPNKQCSLIRGEGINRVWIYKF